MKRYKKFISFIIVFLLIFSPLKVNANSGSFDGFNLNGTYTDGNGATFEAYTYDDGSGGDSQLPNGFKYFYKLNSGKVVFMDRCDVIANILNKKVGIILEPTRLAAFIADYNSGIVGRSPSYYQNLKPVLKQGNLVGVALNGLSGGVIESEVANNPNITIPSSEVNNVYNFYQYWVSLPANKETPEYIVIHGKNGSYFKSIMYQGPTSDPAIVLTNAPEPCFGGYYITYSNGIISGNYLYGFDSNVYLTCSGFATLCNDLGLTLDNREITWDQMRNKTFAGVSVYQYSKSDFTQVKNWHVYASSSGNYSDSTNNASYKDMRGGSNSTGPIICGDLTIWKNQQIISQIQNNTYNSPSYKTNNYNNFDTAYDNSFSITYNAANNGSTTNTNVYNETNTSTNTNITEQTTNIDNSYSYIDNSSIVNENTSIVNNYYNTYYPPNNDDEENNGGGSGGSGSGDNDVSGGNGDNIDNDGFLDTLLAAILKLLRAIGKIIATILTGIVDILTDLLLAITNISTGFDGIIQFIGSIIGFMPSEVVTIITVGLGLSVLIALLKMFGK